jgi:6-pyruvoyltetrahydropterin/6-carboxytetrahydropterin synthase
MQSQLVTATKEFTWDMAHTLFQHKGLCQNLHGHTYRMLVTVSRSNTYVIPTGPSEGMVMDFKELKDLVKREIVDPLDHCTMIDSNNNSAFEVELLELLRRYNKK